MRRSRVVINGFPRVFRAHAFRLPEPLLHFARLPPRPPCYCRNFCSVAQKGKGQVKLSAAHPAFAEGCGGIVLWFGGFRLKKWRVQPTFLAHKAGLTLTSV